MFDRLHRARIERGLDLKDLSSKTALAPWIVRRIDEGRFEDLPRGIYARSYVRAFAAAVGLDADRTIEELAPVLPGTPDPFPVLREIKGQKEPSPPKLQVRSRYVAAAIDAAMLLAIGATVVQLIALACEVSVPLLLRAQPWAVAAVCAVPITAYFVLFGGIGGRTPGAALCRLPQLPAAAPLGLNDIVLRAFR